MLDQALVDGQSGRLGGANRTRVGGHSLEPPARLPVLAQQPQVKAVAAADVEYAGIFGETAAVPKRAPRFRQRTDAVWQPESMAREIECMILWRVDAREIDE